MDAVLFVKEHRRMCGKYIKYSCKHCKLSSNNNGFHLVCDRFIFENPEEAVEIVENWSKEHPVKTNRQKFEEVFGTKLMQLAYTLESGEAIEGKMKTWWDKEYVGQKE